MTLARLVTVAVGVALALPLAAWAHPVAKVRVRSDEIIGK